MTFLRLQPRYRVSPAVAAPCGAALSRGFLPPQRNPSVKIYHSRALPARVTLRPRTYHVPRRFTPFTDSLVSFQPGALAGHAPSELDLAKIVSASQPRLPLLRLADHSRVKQTVKPTLFSTSPRLVVRRPLLERARRLVPLGSVVPNALPALKALLPGAASLQGFRPFAGWRRRFRISPSHDILALLAFVLLETFPFPCPESQR